MAVKKKVTHKLDVPHEPGQWIEFKEVGWRTLERAREAKVDLAIKSYRAFGSELIEAIQEKQETGKELPVPPKEQYDQAIMLHASIIDWSYSEAVTQDNIDELDEQTADWAMEVIAGFYANDEVAEGKDSPSSNELSVVTE